MPDITYGAEPWYTPDQVAALQFRRGDTKDLACGDVTARRSFPASTASRASTSPLSVVQTWPPEHGGCTDLQVCRFAVADGASEASFSGLWARLLVAAYRQGLLTAETLAGALPPLQEAWLNQVTARPLRWYAEEKLCAGAFAALAGITLSAATSTPGGAWNAMAIGDSCLIQVRERGILAAFPVERAGAFDNTPPLVSTSPWQIRPAVADLRRIGGHWLPGDVFYLLTNALACWFLGEYERGTHPWTTLPSP
ncbi:MAG TPA: protein phosphatase 2C domain-containing protein [Chloroflexota bacterium]|nr:protein phosphatase 2C domain-containing protein [Chloroflexota bacterium]